MTGRSNAWWGMAPLAIGSLLMLSGCGNQAANNAGTSGEDGGSSTTASGTGSTSAAAQTVTLGVAGPMTGDSAALGLMLKRGAELARQHLNEAGGINGKQVNLRIEDDQANAAQAATVANNLAGDPSVLAVVGHFNSSCSNSAKPAYSAQGMVMVSPASTAVNVTQNSDFVFRTIFTDASQGASLAVYAARVMGLKRVAVLFDNDDYGTGLKDSFVTKATSLGVEVVSETAYNRGNPDFNSQIAAIKGENIDAIIIAGLYSEAALLVRRAREEGLTVPILGGDGIFSDEFITLAGEAAAEGAIVTCPAVIDEQDTSDERMVKFLQDFRTLHGVAPDSWALQGYDTVMLVADIIKRHGATRQAIHEGIRKMTSPETAFQGITGPTYFDENGDSRKPITFAKVRNGRWTLADNQLSLEDSLLVSGD